MRLGVFTLCVYLVLTLIPGTLSAQTCAPEHAVRCLDRLELALELAASQAHSSRQFSALGQGALGLVTLVPGIVLIQHEDEVRHFLGMGFLIGGAAQLATAPLSLLPTPVERIHDALTQARQAGVDPAEVLRASETRLRDAASGEHTKRSIIGAIDLAIGVGGLVTGMVMIMADDGLAGLSRKAQLNLAATMLGIGSPFTLGGLRMLLLKSHEELTWQAYAGAGQAEVSRREPRGWQLSVGVSPASTGAWATLGTRF